MWNFIASLGSVLGLASCWNLLHSAAYDIAACRAYISSLLYSNRIKKSRYSLQTTSFLALYVLPLPLTFILHFAHSLHRYRSIHQLAATRMRAFDVASNGMQSHWKWLSQSQTHARRCVPVLSPVLSPMLSPVPLSVPGMAITLTGAFIHPAMPNWSICPGYYATNSRSTKRGLCPWYQVIKAANAAGLTLARRAA